jgi:hypothetical protein
MGIYANNREERSLFPQKCPFYGLDEAPIALDNRCPSLAEGEPKVSPMGRRSIVGAVKRRISVNMVADVFDILTVWRWCRRASRKRIIQGFLLFRTAIVLRKHGLNGYKRKLEVL